MSSAEVWKQVSCLFLCQQWATCCFSTVITSQASGLRACVICCLCNGRPEALSCSKFHGEIPACSAVCKWRLQCLLQYRLRIYRRLWAGKCREMKTASVDSSSEQRTGSRPLKKPPTTPDQCQFSLCPEMALMEPRLALSMLSCRWWPSVPTSEVLG